MQGEKTLREVEDQFGVSRRAVQGYEKAGIVSSSGRNKYGYLLYDAQAQQRIAQIRQYQEFGYSIQQIKELIDASLEVRMEMLSRQIAVIQKEKTKMEKNISIMKKMLYEIEESIRREKL